MKAIPFRVTIDPTKRDKDPNVGTKVRLIKAIRYFSGMSLLDAKNAAESDHPVILTQDKMAKTPERVAEGFYQLVELGVMDNSRSADRVLELLREAATISIEIGDTQTARGVMDVMDSLMGNLGVFLGKR